MTGAPSARPGLGDVDRHTLAEIDEPVPHAFERGQPDPGDAGRVGAALTTPGRAV